MRWLEGVGGGRYSSEGTRCARRAEPVGARASPDLASGVAPGQFRDGPRVPPLRDGQGNHRGPTEPLRGAPYEAVTPGGRSRTRTRR